MILREMPMDIILIYIHTPPIMKTFCRLTLGVLGFYYPINILKSFKFFLPTNETSWFT